MRKRNTFYTLLIIIMAAQMAFAQNPSALIDFDSPDKGILIPRLSTFQMRSIPNPADGLMVYNLDLHLLYFYNGSRWGPFGPVVEGGDGITDISAIDAGNGMVQITFTLATGTVEVITTPDLRGPQGDPGEHGIQGDQGIQGEPGEQGIQGEPGMGIAQTLSQDGTMVTLSDGGGTVSVEDGDGDDMNEIQTISRTGLEVTLTDGEGYEDSVNVYTAGTGIDVTDLTIGTDGTEVLGIANVIVALPGLIPQTFDVSGIGVLNVSYDGGVSLIDPETKTSKSGQNGDFNITELSGGVYGQVVHIFNKTCCVPLELQSFLPVNVDEGSGNPPENNNQSFSPTFNRNYTIQPGEGATVIFDGEVWMVEAAADGDSDDMNEIQMISRTGLAVTLTEGDGYEDSVNVYTAGTGIDITDLTIGTDGTEVLGIADVVIGLDILNLTVVDVTGIGVLNVSYNIGDDIAPVPVEFSIHELSGGVTGQVVHIFNKTCCEPLQLLPAYALPVSNQPEDNNLTLAPSFNRSYTIQPGEGATVVFDGELWMVEAAEEAQYRAGTGIEVTDLTIGTDGTEILGIADVVVTGGIIIIEPDGPESIIPGVFDVSGIGVLNVDYDPFGGMEPGPLKTPETKNSKSDLNGQFSIYELSGGVTGQVVHIFNKTCCEPLQLISNNDTFYGSQSEEIIQPIAPSFNRNYTIQPGEGVTVVFDGEVWMVEAAEEAEYTAGTGIEVTDLTIGTDGTEILGIVDVVIGLEVVNLTVVDVSGIGVLNVDYNGGEDIGPEPVGFSIYELSGGITGQVVHIFNKSSFVPLELISNNDLFGGSQSEEIIQPIAPSFNRNYTIQPGEGATVVFDGFQWMVEAAEPAVEVDGSTTNELQDLSLDDETNVLSLSPSIGDPTNVDLSMYKELPEGGTSGQLLSTNGFGAYSWVNYGDLPSTAIIYSQTENNSNLIDNGFTLIGRKTESSQKYGQFGEWATTSEGLNVPSGRSSHTAVWTGTEMIVWGGNGNTGRTNTGGRYNPLTDAWATTSEGLNVPSGRSSHVAVWTGTEMIVWGGDNNTGTINTGGRYNPLTDTWAATSEGLNVPSPRHQYPVVWTGTEMIVWGGRDWSTGGILNTGGRYNPLTDIWAATSEGLNVASPRYIHTAVWTGTEMIVWGGISSSSTNTGGRYNPLTDAWAATSEGLNVPSGRHSHTAVWTGMEMIVWGGRDNTGDTNTGGRYNPLTDVWAATSEGLNVPSRRSQYTVVWTGTEMIVWGGSIQIDFSQDYLNNGSRYNPITDIWAATSEGNSIPTGRSSHTAVWTGTEMIVWGGRGNTNNTNTGGRYDPISTMNSYTTQILTLYLYEKN